MVVDASEKCFERPEGKSDGSENPERTGSIWGFRSRHVGTNEAISSGNKLFEAS